MNPLLDEQESAVREAARAAAEAVVAAVAERVEREAAIPADTRAALRQQGWTREGPAGLVGAVLAVEEVARASGAVGTWLAVTLAAGAYVPEEESAAILVGDALEQHDGRFTGEVGPVVGAADAGRLLLLRRGAGVTVLATDGEGVAVEPTSALGLRGAAFGWVRFTAAAPREQIGEEQQGRALLARWRLLQAARSVGIAQAALDAALGEVQRRRAAGDPVDGSQAVQWMLADSATEIEAARLATWSAAAARDEQERHEAAAVCRVMAAEAAVAASRRTLQIFGARGAVAGSLPERLYRDAKMLEIDGEANEEALRDVADLLLPDVAEA